MTQWAGGKPPKVRGVPEGWGRSILMNHQHYFRHMHALCGRWILVNHALTRVPVPGWVGFNPVAGQALKLGPCSRCWWRWQLGGVWRFLVWWGDLTAPLRARINKGRSH